MASCATIAGAGTRAQFPETGSRADGVQLALAGFYFEPTPSAPDQVGCFSCQKHLDGWEAEDDPVREHLQFSPECPWAIIVDVERCVDDGSTVEDHPMSEKMLEARRGTFADSWPHESKRGWTCKIQKVSSLPRQLCASLTDVQMVEAGWYYCPTADSDDFVKCAYCNLSLDGWEPKDKPLYAFYSSCAFPRNGEVLS